MTGVDPALQWLADAGAPALHKVPSVRYAVKTQSVGVDMLLAERRLKSPFLIDGDIGASGPDTVLTVGSVGNTIRTLKTQTTDIITLLEAEAMTALAHLRP